MSNTSLSDILTAVKNVVTALNNASQTYLNVNGIQSQSNITASTVVKSGAGRIATVSIISGGSANGAIYDSSSAGDTTNQIFTIPNTPGVIFVNLPVSLGILVVPGASQIVSVGFS